MVKMADGQDMAGVFYVWFDTEYSGLELESARLLQVAAMVTDASLRRVLPQEQDVIMPIRLAAGEKLSPWVESNLTELVLACRSRRAVDVTEADNRLAAYVDAVAGPPAEREDRRPVLVRRFLPRFLSRLHYRHLDVTAFKLEWKRLCADREFDKENPEIIRSYFPEAHLPLSESRHDAYYDIQASVAELAFYRSHFLNAA